DTDPGEWLLAQGNHFQDRMLREGRYPDRDDLDRVSAVHPIVYKSSYHFNVFNSCGLATLGVTEETPDAPGGRIERADDGRLTGRTFDMYHVLGGPEVALDTLVEGIKRTQSEYLSVGVTCVGDI